MRSFSSKSTGETRGHSVLLDGFTAIMEYLIVAVILYFILQTAGNLVYILRGGVKPSQRQSPSPPTHGWKGPSPRRQMEGMTDHPTFWGEDVDDATWHEVEEEEERVSSGRT